MKKFLLTTAALAGMAAMAPAHASAIYSLQIVGGSPFTSVPEAGAAIPAGLPGAANGAQLEVVGAPNTTTMLQFFYIGHGDATFENTFSVNGVTAFDTHTTAIGTEYAAPITLNGSGIALIDFSLTSPLGTACNITANCTLGQGSIPTTANARVGDWLGNAPLGFDGVYGGAFIGFADGGGPTGGGPDADMQDLEILVSTPEPATMALLGPGLILLGLVWRRKNT